MSAATKPKSQGYWRIVFKQFRRNRLAVAAAILLFGLFLIALFAPFIAGEEPIYLEMGERTALMPTTVNHGSVVNGNVQLIEVTIEERTYWFPNVIDYRDLVQIQFDRWEPRENDYAIFPPVRYAPERSDLRNNLQPPNEEHLLGTDDRGRDILSRLIWGTRISISVGFVAVGIAVFLGVLMGAAAGYYGGKVDAVVLRFIEIMMCFPNLILILALIAYLGRSIWIIMAVIGITGAPDVARLVRGEFLKLRESDFATAARATGLGDMRIMFRHLLPNALAPVLVNATFGVAGAILIETALSFLGLGVPPPTASWGELLEQSKRYVDFAWWLVTFPGFAIFITVTAFNLVGEGLRDAMDPRLRQ